MDPHQKNFDDQWVEQERSRLHSENLRLRDELEEQLRALEEIYWKVAFSSAGGVTFEVANTIEPILRRAGKLSVEV